ncbi:MAG: alternative ribosome rescue aminoacyl-tRNA hydrolase ArfB [Shewanella sp.]
MIKISNRVILSYNEIEWQFIRASGAGGQHINKVSTAAQLIFSIADSSLPEEYQQKLLVLRDHRITQSGKIIIKCQQSRSQDTNRQTALEQFIALVQSVMITQKKRIATKASRNSQRKRMDSKTQRGQVKQLRQKKFD